MIDTSTVLWCTQRDTYLHDWCPKMPSHQTLPPILKLLEIAMPLAHQKNLAIRHNLQHCRYHKVCREAFCSGSEDKILLLVRREYETTFLPLAGRLPSFVNAEWLDDHDLGLNQVKIRRLEILKSISPFGVL